jgi:hypothetical protein
MAPSASEELLAPREARIPLDDRTIERIARRVAEILRSEQSTPAEKWLTAADVAARYSVSRTWVYDNAELLGVVRL